MSSPASSPERFPSARARARAWVCVRGEMGESAGNNVLACARRRHCRRLSAEMACLKCRPVANKLGDNMVMLRLVPGTRSAWQCNTVYSKCHLSSVGGGSRVKVSDILGLNRNFVKSFSIT